MLRIETNRPCNVARDLLLNVRVIASSELDPQRCASQLKLFSELPLQVAPIGIRHLAQRIAVTPECVPYAARLKTGLVAIALWQSLFLQRFDTLVRMRFEARTEE